MLIDRSGRIGTLTGLMRVRTAAVCQKAEKQKDPVHINTVNCSSDTVSPEAAVFL